MLTVSSCYKYHRTTVVPDFNLSPCFLHVFQTCLLISTEVPVFYSAVQNVYGINAFLLESGSTLQFPENDMMINADG